MRTASKLALAVILVGFPAGLPVGAVADVWATPEPGSAGISVEEDGILTGCLDSPYFLCFAKCDHFWGWCVNGPEGCVQLFYTDDCIDDPYYLQCCEIAIQPGLF